MARSEKERQSKMKRSSQQGLPKAPTGTLTLVICALGGSGGGRRGGDGLYEHFVASSARNKQTQSRNTNHYRETLS